MLSKIQLLVLLAIFGLCAFLILNIAKAPSRFTTSSQTQDEQVLKVMEGLWSADNQERQKAKYELIEMGEAATPALLSLLNDLMRDGSPRYAHGKEQTAARSIKQVERLPDEANSNLALKLASKYVSYAINWRLKKDACDILGSIQSKAAIPSLIQMMRTENRVSAWETFNPAMEALVRIGPPSVPELIKAIDAAESLANTGLGEESNFSYEAKQRIIRRDAAEIRVRSAMVLGEIGDGSALPTLQELFNKTDDEFLIPYLKEAIQKIQNKK